MDTRKTTAETWAGQHPTETVCFCIISDDFSGIGKWTATNKYIAEAGTVRAIKVGIERRPNYPIVVIDPQGYYYRGVDVGFTLSQKGEPVVGGIPFQASGTLKRAA